jgi:hypothetical protein
LDGSTEDNVTIATGNAHYRTSIHPVHDGNVATGKTISTLIHDIYQQVQRKDGWFNDRLGEEFSKDVAKRLQAHLGETKGPPTLRLSQMGPRCPRALWYSIHHPELAEALPPWAEIKYSYGHILEALAICLAKAAGHEVTGEQDELVVDGIRGHRDCVIDGCIVDVKSTSSIGFAKFKDRSFEQSDSFGYLDQLDGYMVGSADDPLVTTKDRGYILAIDKTLGHMVLYEHKLRVGSIERRIKEHKRVVESLDPPPCSCGTIPDGKSGNVRLDVRASYSAFKYCCFPNLRTFRYSDGLRYLSRVERKPDVTEVDKYGKIVYNN